MNDAKNGHSRRDFVHGVASGAVGIAAAGLCSNLVAAETTKPAPAGIKKASAEKITVLNPLGIPPAVQLKPQARRLDTLEGKTLYFVNDGFLGSDNLLYEFMDAFKTKFPTTTLVYRKKAGMGFAAEDPALWEEMHQKADAMIIGLGH
jgi:hypothetical protein